MLLKKNQDGNIKGRKVAGGNKQQTYIPKEDSITESIILTSIMDSKENRYVEVIETPNTFIQTRVEGKKYMAIIKLRGVLVDHLCKISSD